MFIEILSLQMFISVIISGGEIMFRLEDNEVELGLGIHGEAGVKRIEVLFQLQAALKNERFKLKFVTDDDRL